MKLAVRVANREQSCFAACFDDAAQALAEALARCGHEVTGPEAPPACGAREIVFGANNSGWLPGDAIVFNGEQLGNILNADQIARGESIRGRLRQFEGRIIWDYAQTNISELRAAGFERVAHCPVGYVSSMEKLRLRTHQDIDVLWYGSPNDRRDEVLAALDAARLNVKRLSNAYGVERDAWLARSKVVLNWHFYSRPVFEIFRCSYLFANRVPVVTEGGGVDADLEDLAQRTCAVVSREDVVDVCRQLCADSGSRQRLVERAYEEFKKLDLVESARSALAQSGILDA